MEKPVVIQHGTGNMRDAFGISDERWEQLSEKAAAVIEKHVNDESTNHVDMAEVLVELCSMCENVNELTAAAATVGRYFGELDANNNPFRSLLQQAGII